MERKAERKLAFDRIPAAPPIFNRLMLINYAAVAVTIAYGLYSSQPALVFIGAIGLLTFAILSRLGAA